MNCLCSRWVSFFMKQIDWFLFLPKSDRLKTNTLASCTTSLFYVNLFQRTLSFIAPFSNTLYRRQLQVSFVLESGCKGIAFWLTNQIFSQKSCLKTYLFNTCLQLTRVKHLIYLIKYTHAGAWVCACTYTQITGMAGDAVHGTRIFMFLNTNFIFSNTNFIFLNTNFTLGAWEI